MNTYKKIAVSTKILLIVVFCVGNSKFDNSLQKQRYFLARRQKLGVGCNTNIYPTLRFRRGLQCTQDQTGWDKQQLRRLAAWHAAGTELYPVMDERHGSETESVASRMAQVADMTKRLS